ncbi:hypothetical protein D9M68_292810 [compost metagenome]
MRRVAQVGCAHHPVQGQFEGAGRVREEVGDATQGLVLAGIEHMQDGADQQCMAGLFPVIAPLQRALRVDQDVGDVLHVSNFVGAATYLQQRVVGRRSRVGGVEQQAMGEARTPASGQVPVLTLDVMDDRGGRPGEEGGDYQADTFARARRCEGQHMLRTFMAQVLPLEQAKEYPRRLGQPGAAHLIRLGPACRPVGRNLPSLARPPEGHADSHRQGQQAAAGGDAATDVENVRRIGIEEKPPLEQTPRVIDGHAQPFEPGRSQARLVAKRGGRPLRGTPDPGKGNGQHHQHLAVQHRRRLHP